MWRLWLDGSPNAGFAWGGGDRYTTLFVPIPLADAAVTALKAAELRGDYTKLDRLAARMVPPFDQWLAPGERYLELGRDFTCSPQRFLTVLRGKAKERKLRLNGRVDGNGIWVRPERDPVEKFLRLAYPERRGDEPDPYDGPPPREAGQRSQVPNQR